MLCAVSDDLRKYKHLHSNQPMCEHLYFTDPSLVHGVCACVCLLFTVCTWGIPVWVVFEGILPDEIHVLKELFDCSVLMEVYPGEDCWQVHRLLDHFSIIWNLKHRTDPEWRKEMISEDKIGWYEHCSKLHIKLVICGDRFAAPQWQYLNTYFS